MESYDSMLDAIERLRNLGAVEIEMGTSPRSLRVRFEPEVRTFEPFTLGDYDIGSAGNSDASYRSFNPYTTISAQTDEEKAQEWANVAYYSGA